MKTIKLFLIIAQIFISVDLLSQNYYFYVSPSSERARPNQQANGMSSDEILNQIFKEFEVKSYYQSFPGAKNAELQNFYEIHFVKSTNIKHIDAFENALKNSRAFDAIYRSDYYQFACDNPVEINDTWIVNNQINNDALNLLNAQCSMCVDNNYRKSGYYCWSN